MFSKKNHLFNFTVLSMLAVSLTAHGECHAQQAWSYRLVPTTVYEKKPVTVTRWVDETVMEKKQVTSAVPTWQTEKRQRTKTTFVPTQETAERSEQIVLRKPVVETLLRDKTTTETIYEKETRYRDEEYTVLEPVTETEMRTEQYTVRKPETKRMIEVTSRTTYEPVVTSETQLVPVEVPVMIPGTVLDPNARPRVKWLQSGNYTDSVTGQTVYRRRGLHWVAPAVSVPAASVAPALMPQEAAAISYVPKTVEERKPIEITRYVEQIETRKVPVQVEKMVPRTRTRRVPYEVQIPKTVSTTEKIPYTRTTYVEEVVTKKVPYERTVLKKVETTEEYEVEVPKWITKTSEVEVPRIVRKKVEYEVMENVPRTVMMRVPLDICGNPLSAGVPLEMENSSSVPSSVQSAEEARYSTGYGSTQTRPAQTETSSGGSSVLEKPESQNYQSQTTIRERNMLDQKADRTSVLVPRANSPQPDPETRLKPPVVYNQLGIPEVSRDELGASPWRRVDSNPEALEDSGKSAQKTLVEMVKRNELVPLSGDVDSRPSDTAETSLAPIEPEAAGDDELDSEPKANVPNASKPETDVEPVFTGNENAADLPKLKSPELTEGK